MTVGDIFSDVFLQQIVSGDVEIVQKYTTCNNVMGERGANHQGFKKCGSASGLHHSKCLLHYRSSLGMMAGVSFLDLFIQGHFAREVVVPGTAIAFCQQTILRWWICCLGLHWTIREYSLWAEPRYPT